METEELFAVLRLKATPKVGDVIAKKLIQTVGSASQVFKESKRVLSKIDGIGPYLSACLANKESKTIAAKEMAYLHKNNTRFFYFKDPNYPTHLKHCPDGPIILFREGKFNLNTKRIISIVGTRNMTAYGRDFCTALIRDLAPYNPTIVSGFAHGVDICAHKAAFEHNLQTVAVLAHGLEELYPKIHKKYVHQMLNNGGFLSDFWHDDKPLREHFLKRNRIVAGISKATLVIESAQKGGSLVTADIANSYNKDVFALPGRYSDVYSQGCNNLIKTHQAHVLTSIDDIIALLNWEENKPKPVQNELFIRLTSEEQVIYDYLTRKGIATLDTIAVDCALPTYKLSSLLIQLELKGIVTPLPGKRFEV